MNNMQKYTDKYFTRMLEILRAKDINPWINMQVFVRKGPGKCAGMDEAIDIINENSNIADVGGRIYAKEDEQEYGPKETIMNIVVPVQEICELETNYLGIIASAMTRENDGRDANLSKIKGQMEQVVELAGNRTVLYFGARHCHYMYDTAISQLAFDCGISAVATDNGASLVGREGSGTIPHALENVFAYYYGMDRAVVEATKAFDEVIDPSVPRIALVDYNNREVSDAVQTERELKGRLAAVRIDTCGENLGEGAILGNRKYWEGKGVVATGALAVRNALSPETGLYLSSGFSNPEKVRQFNEAEKHYRQKIYDGIGAGFLDDMRCATADIIAVGSDINEVDFYEGRVESKNIVHKVGRGPRPNYTLKRRL